MKVSFLPIFIIVFFSFLFTASAQKHFISLSGEPIEIQGFDFMLDRVIDARKDTTNIGFIVEGNLNAKHLVDLQDGLSNDLFHLFKTSVQPVSNSSALTIKVNHFFIYNLPDENGYINIAEVNMDFYLRDQNKWYHEFQAGTYKMSRGMNSSNKYEKLLRQAIEGCMDDFISRLNSGLGYHQFIDENEMYIGSPEEFFGESIINANRTRGIYHSFNDFRDNITDTKTTFSTKEKGPDDLEDRFIKLKGLNNRDVENIWGIYENGKVYVNVSGYFVPTEYVDGSLVIPVMPLAMDVSQAGMIGLSGMYFGLLGAMVAVAVFIPLDGGVSMDNQGFLIDPVTGMAVPEEVPDYKSVGSEIVFYTGKFKAEDQKIEVYIDGNYQCTLVSESYAFINRLTPGKEIEICLKSMGSEYCETFLLDQASTFYIEAEIKKKDKLSLFPKKSESSVTYIQNSIEKGKLFRVPWMNK